jgi:hypothetical protein
MQEKRFRKGQVFDLVDGILYAHRDKIEHPRDLFNMYMEFGKQCVIAVSSRGTRRNENRLNERRSIK